MDGFARFMYVVGGALILWGLAAFCWHLFYPVRVISSVPEVMHADEMSWVKRVIAAAFEGWMVVPGAICCWFAQLSHDNHL